MLAGESSFGLDSIEMTDSRMVCTICVVATAMRGGAVSDKDARRARVHERGAYANAVDGRPTLARVFVAVLVFARVMQNGDAHRSVRKDWNSLTGAVRWVSAGTYAGARVRVRVRV